MRKIESAVKPELEKIAENKVIDFRVVRYSFDLLDFLLFFTALNVNVLLILHRPLPK